MPRVALSHPFGNPNSYNTALAFHERGLLSSFHTCLFSPFGSRRRYHPALDSAPIRTHPAGEWLRLLLTLTPIAAWNGRNARLIDYVGRGLDQAVSNVLSSKEDVVYAYEDWAELTLRRARELGAKTIYELPTAYFAHKEKLLAAETLRHPDLRPYFQALNEPDEKLRRKEREMQLADRIICPSTFVKQSVEAHLKGETTAVVLPYGASSHHPKLWSAQDSNGPLKLIFAGNLDPQKGLHYLFEALQRLPAESYTLTLAGRWTPGYRRWISRRFHIKYHFCGHVAQTKLCELYRKNDVLVFPSLCDGFGLTILEAMSCGIPVIATERCGAPDIMTHGREGRLVKASHTEDLSRALEYTMNHRDRLAEMGELARRRTEELTWGVYRQRIVDAALQPIEAPAQMALP
jgi:starch synthase